MQAEDLKTEGNSHFKSGDFQKALDCYKRASEIDPTNAIYLSNKAQCELNLEQYGDAIESTSKAIETDSKHVKSFYRRGLAYASLLNHAKALADFQQVAKLNPEFTAVNPRITATKKLLREQNFLAAIKTEDEPSIFDVVDIESMPLYDSPETEIEINLDQLTIETIERVIEHFKQGKKLSRRMAFSIIKRCSELFSSESTLVRIPKPAEGGDELVTVCGDVHGQFYDFLNIFKLNGMPSKTHTYLFNGDFVDRGSWSTEIALTLYLLKLLYPQNLFINRGNHESVSMNMVYGFSGECKAKYISDNIFKAFTESFSRLPVSAVIGDAHFVVHGGIASESPILLKDIEKIDRFQFKQPNDHPLLTELMWSDPRPAEGLGNNGRGVAHVFGPDVTTEFLKANNLKTVIRSHESKDEGYQYEHNKQLITVFSAPNYCDCVGNKGAFINIRSDLELDVVQFSAVEHPAIPSMAYAANSI